MSESDRDEVIRVRDVLRAPGAFQSVIEEANARGEATVRAIAVSNAERAGFAWTMYKALEAQLKEFEEKLSPEEEVAALLANFGANTTIVITGLGYRHPHLVVFRGEADDGEEVELVQHVSQVTLLFKRMPTKPSKPARRIGFLANLGPSEK